LISTLILPAAPSWKVSEQAGKKKCNHGDFNQQPIRPLIFKIEVLPVELSLLHKHGLTGYPIWVFDSLEIKFKTSRHCTRAYLMATSEKKVQTLSTDKFEFSRRPHLFVI
jgi:hypothetical protein